MSHTNQNPERIEVTPPAVASSDGLSGVELIASERQRQISSEGWSADHDDTHDKGEMAQAAASYALHAAGISSSYPKGIQNGCCMWWPWAKRWWKPRTPIKDLVRAGALIAAEIDRLQRIEAKAR